MKVSRRRFGAILGVGFGGFFLDNLLVTLDWREPSSTDKHLTFNSPLEDVVSSSEQDFELLIPTFLGNNQRRFYGRGKPSKLDELHRFELGSGKTFVGHELRTWSGAGWTGQPTLVRDGESLNLVIGGFDHHLRRINLSTGCEEWRYTFDDVIKGTATIYEDVCAQDDNRLIILQGSRRGVNCSLSSPVCPSLRAISFRTGEELWRLNVGRTRSYSRDNDSSPLFLGEGLIFDAAENGRGYFISSQTSLTNIHSGHLWPEVIAKILLYNEDDVKRHGGNLVAEASPAVLGDIIYLASGSGHIYGISIPYKRVVWDFLVGSDLDGSTPISLDGKIFCPVEEQYVPGHGGLLKLNPEKSGIASIEWFLPTESNSFCSWEGGIIGSPALNDEYRSSDEPALFAVVAIDGFLYLGSQNELAGSFVEDPLHRCEVPTPKLLSRVFVGPSIATPIFTDGGGLVVPSYDGVRLFSLELTNARVADVKAVRTESGDPVRVYLEERAHFKQGYSFEATPIVWDDLVYIAGRDGFLHILG